MEQTQTVQNPLGYKKIPSLLAAFAIPSIIATLVSSLYNIVDQVFIGQGVGYLGNAATNVSYPLTTICLAIPAYRHWKRLPLLTQPRRGRTGRSLPCSRKRYLYDAPVRYYLCCAY